MSQDETDRRVWWEDPAEDEEDDLEVTEYDITAAPNDFNVSTILNFLENRVISMPGFQRHYVWDIRRASRLIESIIIGIPVPQVFLFEREKNRFEVIDGQQRLMSLFYFHKERFPRQERRAELRVIFDKHGTIPDEVFLDDEYFRDFKLQLPHRLPQRKNRLHGLTYSTLGEDSTSFNLRTIRNVIVKQNNPEGDDSAVFEIFSRLNSGGVNLTPQELRSSLYHSEFYKMLHRVNSLPEWRRLIGIDSPDKNMKDVEFLLRGFALLLNGEQYSPSMNRFLNQFSKAMRKTEIDKVKRLERLFESFLDACQDLPERAFFRGGQRFSIAMFESVFVAACEEAYREEKLITGKIEPESLEALKRDSGFIDASGARTSDSKRVRIRLMRAREFLRGNV